MDSWACLSWSALASLIILVSNAAAGGLHNILFVVVDDLPMHISPILDENHPLRLANVRFTPTIQELADESLIFDRAFSQNAACNPSRASFLTSRTPIDLQLFTRYPVTRMKTLPLTMPQAFRRTHYVMGTGKIFHNDWKDQFDQFIPSWPGDEQCKPKEDQCILPEVTLADSKVTTKALTLIRKAPRGRPWFTFVGFHRPHWKYSTSALAYSATLPAADLVRDQVEDASLLGALEGPNDVNKAPIFASAVTRNVRAINARVAVSRATANRQAIFASTQWMDTCLQRLITGIKSMKYVDWNNTIVILASDNGVMMFDRAQSGKSVLWSGAKHVPFMIRHPDFPKSWGKVSGAPAQLMDIFPTLVESEQLVANSLRMSGSSVMPMLRLFNTESNEKAAELYRVGTKVGSITIETRCVTGPANTLSKLPSGQRYRGDWVACHQLANVGPNRAEMFGLSIQTPEWNYIEWRVAQFGDQPSTRVPRWDKGGLWGRELYDFRKDTGKTKINGVEFERVNLAPCAISCFPRSLDFPVTRWASNSPRPYPLPNDASSIDFDAPDLEGLDPVYVDTIKRLSLILRSTIRDSDPVCSGHGTANPLTGLCDRCIPGWNGPTCANPTYPELATPDFPLAPTLAPSGAPSFSPSLTPPTRSPTRSTPPTKAPTFMTRRPTPKKKSRRGLFASSPNIIPVPE